MNGSASTARRVRTHLITGAIAAGIVALCGVPSGTAAAATLSDSVTLTVHLDSPGSGTLKAFDPALGTLTSVELTIRTDVLVQNCIENLSATAGSTVGGPVSANLTAQFPSGQNSTAASVDTAVPSTDLPVSNGADNCAPGPDATTGRYNAPVSASDVRFFQDDDTATTARTFTAAADMEPFVGPGTVPFSYTSASLADITQPSEWDIVFVAQGNLAITVTYTYSEVGGDSGVSTTTTPCVAPTTTVAGVPGGTLAPGTVVCEVGALPTTGSSSSGLVTIAAVTSAVGVAALAISRRFRVR